MAALDLGPSSLRARAATLGGSMVMESSPSGTRLEFTLYVPIA
jgi:signal transduction histidine kinase